MGIGEIDRHLAFGPIASFEGLLRRFFSKQLGVTVDKGVTSLWSPAIAHRRPLNRDPRGPTKQAHSCAYNFIYMLYSSE